MTNLISYYDSQSLQDVVSMDSGLLMTLSTSVPTRRRTFTVYKTRDFPMHHLEPEQFLRCITDQPYLGLTEDTLETAVLLHSQLDKCIGSSRYRKSHDAIPTYIGHSACVATFYFGSNIGASGVCEPECLPSSTKASRKFRLWNMVDHIIISCFLISRNKYRF